MRTSARKNKKNLEIAVKAVSEHFGDVFHEWNTKKAQEFFGASGISERNWRVFMRSVGMADGERWTLRRIADEEGNISHVRAWQIVQQTRKNLKKLVMRLCE